MSLCVLYVSSANIILSLCCTDIQKEYCIWSNFIRVLNDSSRNFLFLVFPIYLSMIYVVTNFFDIFCYWYGLCEYDEERNTPPG